MYPGKAPILSPSIPPKILPNAPKIIKTIKTEVANSRGNPASVNKGTKCIIGTDIHTQQKITAKLIQATTSFSESGKSVVSETSSVRAFILQGDSLINRDTGKAIMI